MEKENELLYGDPGKHLIRLAAPLIVGNILQQFYNTFDVFVVGRFAGQNEYAALGVAGSLMNLFLFALAGMCTGMLVLLARSWGAGNMADFRRQHAASLQGGLGTVLVLSVLGLCFLQPLLAAMRTPVDILPGAEVYLRIILIGLPASFLYNLYASLLRAIGQTRVPTAALAVAVLLNLGLDLLLVGSFHIGVAGAALATVFSQLVAAGVCITWLVRHERALLINREDLKPDLPRIRRTLSLSFVTALHQCSIYLGKLLVQGTVNAQGLDLIAAYTTTGRIEGFANSFGDSGAAATSILVAQSYGAGDRERVQTCFRRSLQILLLFGVIISLILFFTAAPAARLLLGTREGEAFQNTVRYLRLIACFYPLCFTGNTFAGTFEGLGKAKIPFIGAASHLTIRVILSMLLISAMKLPAVALATGIGWLYVNILWAILYKKQK